MNLGRQGKGEGVVTERGLFSFASISATDFALRRQNLTSHHYSICVSCMISFFHEIMKVKGRRGCSFFSEVSQAHAMQSPSLQNQLTDTPVEALHNTMKKGTSYMIYVWI